MSDLDVTFPADDEKVSNAEMRQQIRVIRDEIAVLESRSGVAGAQVFYGFVNADEVKQIVKQVLKKRNFARDYAFGYLDILEY